MPAHHHLPGQPRRRCQRGLYAAIVSALGGVPTVPQSRADPPSNRGYSRLRKPRSGKTGRARSWTRPTCSTDEQLEELRHAHQPRDGRPPARWRWSCCWASPPCAGASSWAPSPRSTSGSRCATTLDGMDPRARPVGYLRHHLKLAGRSDPLFSDDAVALVHQHSPRHAPRGQQPRHASRWSPRSWTAKPSSTSPPPAPPSPRPPATDHHHPHRSPVINNVPMVNIPTMGTLTSTTRTRGHQPECRRRHHPQCAGQLAAAHGRPRGGCGEGLTLVSSGLVPWG